MTKAHAVELGIATGAVVMISAVGMIVWTFIHAMEGLDDD